MPARLRVRRLKSGRRNFSVTPQAERPSLRRRAATRSQWTSKMRVSSALSLMSQSKVVSLEMLFGLALRNYGAIVAALRQTP